jgi:folylpolyglutamate synthase/dihydropteroate synthase
VTDLRFFVSHADGRLDCVDIPANVDSAMDIMLEGGLNPTSAAEMAWALRDHENSEKAARHIVTLVDAMKRIDRKHGQ